MFVIMNSVSKILRRGVILIAALIFMLVAFWVSTWAQSENPDTKEEYVNRTGHMVTGKFYERYHQVENPLLLYGFPITDQFYNPEDEKVVQYFSRARFEQGNDGEVTLTHIGSELLKKMDLRGAAQNENRASYACKEFPPTDFQVCLNFLEFFEKYGGVAQFGNPVSNQINTGTVWVQYFENAVMEFHHDGPSGTGGIRLADIGETYFNLKGEPLHYKLPTMKEFILDDVLSLEVNAFIHRDPAAAEYQPTVYAIVRDQRQIPLENASLEIIVQYADGKEESVLMPPTNEHGFSKTRVPVTEDQPGIVELKVKATYNNLEGGTKAAFRIWY
jgi:hypothetical protein